MGDFKTCPECRAEVGDWRQTCDCGFVFYTDKKVRVRPSPLADDNGEGVENLIEDIARTRTGLAPKTRARRPDDVDREVTVREHARPPVTSPGHVAPERASQPRGNPVLGLAVLVALGALIVWTLARDASQRAGTTTATTPGAGAPTRESTAEWTRYNLPICGFSVLLPRAPTFKSQTGADKGAEATSYGYLAMSSDGFFDASCMDLTHAKLDQTAALKFYAREPERIRQAFSGASLQQGDALIDGQAGAGFSFRHTLEGSDEWCAEYRILFTDARAYYFGMSVRCRDDNRDAVDRFFASISLASEAVVIQGPSATHPRQPGKPLGEVSRPTPAKP